MKLYRGFISLCRYNMSMTSPKTRKMVDFGQVPWVLTATHNLSHYPVNRDTVCAYWANDDKVYVKWFHSVFGIWALGLRIPADMVKKPKSNLWKEFLKVWLKTWDATLVSLWTSNYLSSVTKWSAHHYLGRRIRHFVGEIVDVDGNQ